MKLLLFLKKRRQNRATNEPATLTKVWRKLKPASLIHRSERSERPKEPPFPHRLRQENLRKPPPPVDPCSKEGRYLEARKETEWLDTLDKIKRAMNQRGPPMWEGSSKDIYPHGVSTVDFDVVFK